MTFARIFLEEVNSKKPEWLTIQVFLGPDNIPSRQFPYAGWRGRPGKGGWCWPVVFMPDGLVDHGGYADEPAGERFSEMNIYECPFQVGSRHIMNHGDGSAPTQFIVSTITPLHILSFKI